MSTRLTNLGGDPIVEGGGVGLLPALCLRRIAWVLFTLVMDSCLLPFSGPKAGEGLSVPSVQGFNFIFAVDSTEKKATSKQVII